MFLFKTLYSHSASLHPAGVYMGTGKGGEGRLRGVEHLTNVLEVTRHFVRGAWWNARGTLAMDWYPVHGGVVILLVASWQGNWDKFRLVGSLGSSSDFVVVLIDALQQVMNVVLWFFFVSALFWKIVVVILLVGIVIFLYQHFTRGTKLRYWYCNCGCIPGHKLSFVYKTFDRQVRYVQLIFE